jgi:hypothetical protein
MADEYLAELTAICGEARELVEAGIKFIHLRKLRLPGGCQPAEVEALLCLGTCNGYLTRLFLSQQVAGKRSDWLPQHILGRTWYTWSWNGVPAHLRPAEILAEHLRALR